MSTAWQGNVLIGIGSSLIVASVGAFVAKDPAPMSPIVAMAVSGMGLALVGIIYVRKADEWARNRERRLLARNKRDFIEALSAPVTEEYLREELHDPFGNEIPLVRKYLDELLAKKATQADPRSPRPPKRGR